MGHSRLIKNCFVLAVFRPIPILTVTEGNIRARRASYISICAVTVVQKVFDMIKAHINLDLAFTPPAVESNLNKGS